MQANRGVIRMTTLSSGIPLQAFRDGVSLWPCSPGRGLGAPVSYSLPQNPPFPGQGLQTATCMLVVHAHFYQVFLELGEYPPLPPWGRPRPRVHCCLFPQQLTLSGQRMGLVMFSFPPL